MVFGSWSLSANRLTLLCNVLTAFLQRPPATTRIALLAGRLRRGRWRRFKAAG